VLADVEDELPPPDKVVDEQNFKKVKNFYETCLDEDQIDRLGAEPLYPLFQEIQKLVPTSDFQVQDAKQVSKVLSFLMQRGVNPLFELIVTPDDKDPDSYAIQMWQSGLGMTSKEYYDDEHYVKSYQEIVTEILQVLFSKDDGKFGWRYSSPAATAKRIVEFEKELAKVSDTSDQLQDPESIYNPFTITELHERSNKIDWDLLISDMLPASAARPKQVIVTSPNYLGNISNPVLDNANSRTLQYYFIWQTLLTYINDLGEEYTRPKRKLDALLSGVSARVSKPRWEYCVRQIDSALGFLVGRYYVLDQFKGDARERADSFVESINDAFVDRLPELTWIDETTKKRAVEKVLSYCCIFFHAALLSGSVTDRLGSRLDSQNWLSHRYSGYFVSRFSIRVLWVTACKQR
jgi:endothelin-converting enzyme